MLLRRFCPGRRFRLAFASAALTSAAAFPAAAGADAPDVAARTPVATSAAATAQTAISAGKLRRGLRKQLNRVGGSSGAFVEDMTTESAVFARSDRIRLILASNMKLFTTGTALTRFGPDATLDTSAWRLGSLNGGTLHGALLLRGGGDPTLTGTVLARLASRIKAAGVHQITGRVRFDDSLFDRRRGVPSTGVGGGPYLGSLSGLSFNYGFNHHGQLLKDPGRSAAAALARVLRKLGVSVVKRVKRGQLPAGTPDDQRLALIPSPDMAELIALTNAPSDNFMAEMLAKDVGARFGGGGTTATGVKVIRAFARKRGAGVKGENGSGLSRRNRATPRAVARFLVAMQDEDPPVAHAFLDSLAIAGHTGTLADRMRGTAADGRCHAKTGTLDGVSALSGYCLAAGGRKMAFSTLMNGVDINRAHAAQDKIAALIARYSP